MDLISSAAFELARGTCYAEAEDRGNRRANFTYTQKNTDLLDLENIESFSPMPGERVRQPSNSEELAAVTEHAEQMRFYFNRADCRMMEMSSN